MTRIRGTVLTIPGLMGGLRQNTAIAPLGTFVSASNFVPLRSGRMAVRNGSRVVNTLHDSTNAELTHICRIHAFSPVGMIAVGWSAGQNKHYAYRLTNLGAFFTGSEATSRVDLTASPSTDWTTGPARPTMAELWEKVFLADGTPTYANRNTFLSIDESGVVTEPHFAFAGGAAQALRPYCCEEFNNVLFLAGYGDESVGDRPEMVRHSFLGVSPATAATGFDAAAWIMIGAKGQRVTAMCKGDTAMLVAKTNELYRVSGYGRAYAGWQYEVQHIQQNLGLGCFNPYALCFAEGYWYGVGEAGPFRTDGVRVEPLRGPREQAWDLLSDSSAFFVDYHPDRGLVFFGVRQATGLPPGLYLSGGVVTPAAATYPNVLWAWDVAREVWTSDHGYNLSWFHVRAVPSTTPATPQGTPTATAATGATVSGYTGNWTNGDATCATEFYERAGAAGSFALISPPAAAGAVSYPRTGLTSHTLYSYYLVHLKGGVRSTASNTIDVRTLIAPPVTAGVAGSEPLVPSSLTVTVTENGLTLVIEESANGVSGWSTVDTIPNFPAGSTSFFEGSSVVVRNFHYRAYLVDLTWTPPQSVTSNVSLIPPPL